MAKFNQLIQIEEILGEQDDFPGKKYFRIRGNMYKKILAAYDGSEGSKAALARLFTVLRNTIPQSLSYRLVIPSLIKL